MHVTGAKAAFEAFAEGRGVSFARVGPGEAMDVMLAWYEAERAEDADLDADGDMLLYQWGSHDWGAGPSFQIDITRQLISVGAADDDIWQLSLTLHFEPTEEAQAIGSGNRWCDHPSDVPELRAYIFASRAMELARNRAPTRRHLEYFQV